MAEKPEDKKSVPPKTPEKSGDESEKKLPVPNGIEKKSVQKNKEFQESKTKLKKLREKKVQEKATAEEKSEAGKKFDSAASAFDLGPGNPPKKDDNYVESPEVKEVNEAEKEALIALKEKQDAEIDEVKESGSLDGLLPETKKAVHSEIIRRSLDPEKTPEEFIDLARKEILGPQGMGPETPEESLKIKDLAVLKQADKIREEYGNALAEDVKKTPPGNTAEALLKGLDPLVADSVTLKVLKKGPNGEENTTKIGEETAMEIAERVLAEKNLGEFLGIVGKKGFDIKKLPTNIKRQMFLNENFDIPDEIKETIDGIKLAVGAGEMPIDRADYPEGPEGDKAYGEAMKKNMEDYTGLGEADMSRTMQKLQNSPSFQSGDFKKMSPFMKLLADILCGFGAALEEGGYIQGDFWRRYIASKKAQGAGSEYTENGGSSPGFEVGKTISGEELISSAEKYLGKPYEMGGIGRLDVPGDPIDCSQLVVNSLRDLGCVSSGFDTTASGFASRSELAGQMSGQPGDFLIRTEGGSDHIAIITGGPDAQGNYQTIESTSRNPAGSGVIKTTRQASPDGTRSGFRVYRNPFLHGNKPEYNMDENIPEGGASRNIVPTHYWHTKEHDAGLDAWTAKGQTKSGVSLFDKSGNGITPETHGYGFCAVDPSVIPLGSIVIANGKKYYAVDIGTDVTNGVAAKARGLSGTPVIDFFSKSPVGTESRGQSMNVRVISPGQSDRSLEELKKGYVPRAMPELDPSLSGNAKKIVDYALQACSRGDVLGAAHCTDWVDRVYKKTRGSSVYEAPQAYNGVTHVRGGTGFGGTPAPLDKVSRIVAGQHLMLDKPGGNGSYGVGKTHSVIALGTPDSNGHVKVVSYPGSGVPKVEIYDLTPPTNGSRDSGVHKNGKVIRIQGP